MKKEFLLSFSWGEGEKSRREPVINRKICCNYALNPPPEKALIERKKPLKPEKIEKFLKNHLHLKENHVYLISVALDLRDDRSGVDRKNLKKIKLAFDKSKMNAILNARYAKFEKPRKGGAEKKFEENAKIHLTKWKTVLN